MANVGPWVPAPGLRNPATGPALFFTVVEAAAVLAFAVTALLKNTIGAGPSPARCDVGAVAARPMGFLGGAVAGAFANRGTRRTEGKADALEVACGATNGARGAVVGAIVAVPGDVAELGNVGAGRISAARFATHASFRAIRITDGRAVGGRIAFGGRIVASDGGFGDAAEGHAECEQSPVDARAGPTRFHVSSPQRGGGQGLLVWWLMVTSSLLAFKKAVPAVQRLSGLQRVQR